MPRLTTLVALALLPTAFLNAETGYAAWLRYAPISDRALPATVVRLGNASALQSAQSELIGGVKSMFGKTLRASNTLVAEDSILLTTTGELNRALPSALSSRTLAPDAFAFATLTRHGRKVLLLTGQNERGVLYGVFELLRRLSLRRPLPPTVEVDSPAAPVRWVNQWDNLDGSIERGYAGRSIFFVDQHVWPNLQRAADYARLLASVGDAANVLAAALRPHGGIAVYRAFVYDHHTDWRNLKNDRARAAYDNFHPLDGKFAANVILQIKHGPIDFQAREPVSPLFAGLTHTNEAVELQITQEYTGQQRHLCYLVPMWKQVLDFDTGLGGENAALKNVVSGRRFNRPLGGFIGVANVGLDANWLGNHLALANLYGFGRLAWNPNLAAREITDEWTRQTFGSDPKVVDTITALELESWSVYEGYTGPLGMGTLTNILHGHYGPAIESAERNGWGQWFRADRQGLGMDRTVATGTGYIGQYPVPVAQRFESLRTCPESLLLFMHHVPYTYRLHSGHTLVQYVYDSHYAAAEKAQQFADRWRGLYGRIDDERYHAVLAQLDYQAGHAIVWRDAICTWFFNMSGIADSKVRVGHDQARVEAEGMQLHGYQVVAVTPPETASGEHAVSCNSNTECSASFSFHGAAGWYSLDVFYYDEISGAATFQVKVGEQLIAVWKADESLVSAVPNGDTATRRRITGIALRPGDTIQLIGTPDHDDRAALDYIRLSPKPEIEPRR